MARRVALATAVSVCLSIGSFLSIAGPARAATSRFHEATYRFTGRVDCGSFVDRYADRYWVTTRTFFFASGRPARTIEHVRHSSTERNSVTGLVLHQHDRYTIVTDLRNGTIRVAGGLFRINRSGRGMVIHDVGRVVMDGYQNLVFTAGRHDVLGEDSTVFCRALA
jgi:hypothetical protein